MTHWVIVDEVGMTSDLLLGAFEISLADASDREIRFKVRRKLVLSKRSKVTLEHYSLPGLHRRLGTRVQNRTKWEKGYEVVQPMWNGQGFKS